MRRFLCPALVLFSNRRSDAHPAAQLGLKFDYLDAAGVAFNGVASRSLDPKEFLIAANLIWSPVSGLDIGVEVLYSHLDVRSPVGIVDNAGNRSGILGIKSEDSVSGRLRIQRDF